MNHKKIVMFVTFQLIQSLHASGELSENYADDATVCIQAARSSGQPGMRHEVEVQFIDTCPNCLPEVAIQSTEQVSSENTINNEQSEESVAVSDQREDQKDAQEIKIQEESTTDAQELLEDAVKSAEKLHEIAENMPEQKPEPLLTQEVVSNEIALTAQNDNPVVVEKIVYVYPVYERLQKTAAMVTKTAKELWNFMTEHVQSFMKKKKE